MILDVCNFICVVFFSILTVLCFYADSQGIYCWDGGDDHTRSWTSELACWEFHNEQARLLRVVWRHDHLEEIVRSFVQLRGLLSKCKLYAGGRQKHNWIFWGLCPGDFSKDFFLGFFEQKRVPFDIL